MTVTALRVSPAHLTFFAHDTCPTPLDRERGTPSSRREKGCSAIGRSRLTALASTLRKPQTPQAAEIESALPALSPLVAASARSSGADGVRAATAARTEGRGATGRRAVVWASARQSAMVISRGISLKIADVDVTAPC